VFTIQRNRCSDSPGIAVQIAPESVFTLLRNGCSDWAGTRSLLRSGSIPLVRLRDGGYAAWQIVRVRKMISSGLLDRRQFCLELALLIAASAAQPRIANAAASGRDIKALSESSYIYIATVRKDGNQSTAAPVWFITNLRNEILIDTSPKSWKAKRIQRGSPVIV
jgi:hypothetical protein